MEKINYNPNKNTTIYWVLLAGAIAASLFLGGDSFGMKVLGITLSLIPAAILAWLLGIMLEGSFKKRVKVIYMVILYLGALYSWTTVNYKPVHYPSSGGSSSETRSVDCPHCGGTGSRTNNVTGQFGKCASCSGTGKVTQSQYDHLK